MFFSQCRHKLVFKDPDLKFPTAAASTEIVAIFGRGIGFRTQDGILKILNFHSQVLQVLKQVSAKFFELGFVQLGHRIMVRGPM